MAEKLHKINNFFMKQQKNNLESSRKYMIALLRELGENASESGTVVFSISNTKRDKPLYVALKPNEVVYLKNKADSEFDKNQNRYSILLQKLFDKKSENRKRMPEIQDIDIMDQVLDEIYVVSQKAGIQLKGKYFPILSSCNKYEYESNPGQN
jgi:hypothetical protein